MKKTTLLFALFFTVILSAQIRFEKAYYIDNANNRVEGLIKNVDWKNNPAFFEYKSAADSDIKTVTVKDVKLFEIYDQSKFVSSTVDFDKSSINIRNLSESKEPEWVQRQLFLKQIVSGPANLYVYAEGNDNKFFYQKGDDQIKQLIYKPYQVEIYQIGYNDSYKQQLTTALTCGTMNKNQINNTPYQQKNLVDLFTKYNQCSDPNYEVFEVEKKPGKLNLAVRPRVNFASLQLRNSTANDLFDFGNTTEFGVGVELEYVFPFNKSKWAVILEPTYRTYKAEMVIEPYYMAGNKLFAFADYNSIEFPIGIRYYMFIDSQSKIFINGQYIFDLALDSSLQVRRADESVSQDIDVKAFANFAFGAGYSYKSKYGVEVRYFTSRNIARGYANMNTSYKNISLILSYNLF
ncbi:PorT family protein [Kaistella flava (ex Peng et al. 2021)]|uniref:PorT family protein n=1 Tax=Kaistella flava (ex Peng et al. 2021) TaxID=2038776 RepID=A0A7M2Y7L3_9FLAO|nr:tRNA modification GTPase [Kaistella flava (ex Peng et al. 2021)]QOW10247.1 PorT family protein [Kaistella flava (ex Peng et al. 2021)]